MKDQARAQKIYRQMSKDAAVNSIHTAEMRRKREERQKAEKTDKRTAEDPSLSKKWKLKKIKFFS